MGDGFGHEQLHAYQRALGLVAYTAGVVASLSGAGSIKDQIERAAESVPLNIVDGNSRWSPDERNRYLDIAHGSCLECAGCLDVCVVKELIPAERATAGKALLIDIIRPLVGLRRVKTQVRETDGEYHAEGVATPTPYFAHERLDVYRTTLEFVGWNHHYFTSMPLHGRLLLQLDRATISIPLNIAEGNGRFTILDHQHFLDIARRSALRAATLLDIIATQNGNLAHGEQDGKGILRRIVAMLLAMQKTTERVSP